MATNCIDMTQKTLKYYGGNYDQFQKTKSEADINQKKSYVKQQDEIKAIRAFVASAGTYVSYIAVLLQLASTNICV